MKLTKYHPRNLFRSKKSKSSVSRTDDPRFGSGSSLASSDASSSSANLKEGSSSGTPTSVLPVNNPFLVQSKSGMEEEEWSAETHFELVEAFKLIDKDGDGKITRSELEPVLQRVGGTGEPPSKDEVMSMFSEIDLDGDGFITLEEFTAISSAFEPAVGSELCDVFDFFDSDKNGKISAEELLGVFMAIGDERCTLEECISMISGVDSDGDGFVCFQDFSKMMERQR